MKILLILCTILCFGCVKVENEVNGPSALLPENEHFVKYENGILTTRRTRPQIPPIYRVYQVVGSELKFQVQFVGNN